MDKRATTLAYMDEYPSAPTAVEDVQARVPNLSLSLSRVGVTGVEKVIRIKQDGAEQLFSAQLECFVDLGPRQKGAHMSRFEEVVNDVIGEVVLGESGFKAEQLAQHIAENVRERQDAQRAEVTIAARYPEHKPAPMSGIPTQEIYTLLGSAIASERGTRRLVGVAAQGMTACPGAQEVVARRSRERLAADGFTDDEIRRILEAVPVTTHNQRGLGTLHLGLPEDFEGDVDAAELLEIVEDAMSSEVYELMKRSDEPSSCTASSPSASGCSASCAGSSTPDSTSRITRRCVNGSTPPPDQRTRIRSAPWTLRWSSADPLASATPRRSTSAA